MAKELRAKFANVLRRYFAGDKSLIGEIQANAESTSPIPKLARAADQANHFQYPKIASIMDDDYISKMERYTEAESARIRNMASEFNIIDTITSKINSIDPNWTAHSRLKTVKKLESIMFGPEEPEDVQRISKKPRVEEPEAIRDEALPPIQEDLPSAVLPEEASPISEGSNALVLPEEASSISPEQLLCVSYVANSPARLVSLPAFNLGNDPSSSKVREEIVLDAMDKFFAEGFEECPRRILYYSDIFQAFTESFCVASGRDAEVFSQKCQILLTSRFPFVVQCTYNQQRSFVNVRFKLDFQ